MAREVPRLLRRTYDLWRDDAGGRTAAALTYYVLLSMAPLLVLLVGLVGAYLDRAAVVSRVLAQADALAGPLGVRAVRALIAAAAPSAHGRGLTVVAALVALSGAMQVFRELRAALERMWDVPQETAPPGALWAKVRWWLAAKAQDDLAAFAVVLALGLLFVAGLAGSAVVGHLADAVPPVLPGSPALVRVLDSTFSVALLAALFAVVYRFLPRTRIAWSDVAVGALATAALFVAGRIALGIYFTYAGPGSAYGAAGSLLALLLWIDYSVQIVLFGAEFTYVWAHEHGSRQRERLRRPRKPAGDGRGPSQMREYRHRS